MSIIKKIYRIFNSKKEKLKLNDEHKSSIKVQSTVKPSHKYTFNEISENIYKEYKKLK